MVKKVISFGNNKGGVGKTTTAFNIIHAFAKKKKKILVIDLDSQANLTTALNSHTEYENTIFDILVDNCSIEDAMVKINNKIDILPSDHNLASIGIMPECHIEFDKLKTTIKPLRDQYDYIVVDPSPTMSLLTINSIVATDILFIPVKPKVFDLHSLAVFFNNIIKVFNPEIKVGGIFFNSFKKNIISHRDAYEMLKDHYPQYLMKETIRSNTSLAESVAHNQSIFEYDKNSNGAKDFDLLVKQILKIIKSI